MLPLKKLNHTKVVFSSCAGIYLFLQLIGSAAAAKQARSCALEEVYYLQNYERIAKSSDTTILASDISREPGGPIIGINIARLTELGLENKTPGKKGMTEVSITNFLPDGHLVSYQIVDSDQTAALVERTIIGGTGRYKGAHGVFTRQPLKVEGKDYFKITFKIHVHC